MKNIWKWIVPVLVLGLIISGGSILLYSGTGEKDRTENEPKQPRVVSEQPTQTTENGEPQKIQASAAIDISNWKTYKNEEYGFEMKYPNDAIVRIGELEKEHPEYPIKSPGRLIRLLYVEEKNRYVVNIEIHRNDPSLNPQKISKQVLFSGDIEKYTLLFSDNQQKVFFQESRDENNSINSIAALSSIVYNDKHPYFFHLGSVDYSGISSEIEALFLAISESLITF